MKVLKMKYGSNGDNVDAFGIRFYGEFDRQTTFIGSMNEMFSDPHAPPMIKSKRITLWFTFKMIRPYKHLSDHLDELRGILKKEGYAITLSSIDNLVNTKSPEYAGKPECLFSDFERMHDYNAGGGFSATAEKEKDAGSKFSKMEVDIIQELAVRFAQAAFGRHLMRLI